MTRNTLIKFFAEVLVVTAANGNLDRWSIMANTHFPFGSGPRKSIFNVSQTLPGKWDGWISAGGVGRLVDWQAIQLFILSSIPLSMPIENTLLLIKAFVFCTPWCPTWASFTAVRWNIVGKTTSLSFKMISYWMFTLNISLNFWYYFNNFKVSTSYCFLSIHFHSLFSIVCFRNCRTFSCLVAVATSSKIKAFNTAVEVTKFTYLSTTVLSISLRCRSG